VGTHTLLNYLSALGAHRDLRPASSAPAAPDPLALQAAEQLAAQIEHLAAALRTHAAPAAPEDAGAELVQALEAPPPGGPADPPLLRLRLARACRQLAPLRAAAAQLVRTAPG